MNERLMVTSFTLLDPTNTNALGDNIFYFDAIVDMTIVGVSAAAHVDDAGATVDIDDDGSNVIAGVTANDANVPGTWKTPGFGAGTNTPVHIAAGSKVSFDVNGAEAGTAVHVVLYWLTGEEST